MSVVFMKYLLAVAFATLAILSMDRGYSNALSILECVEPNTEFKECIGCPLTCDNLHEPPAACAAQCTPGCGCKDGYVLNPAGQCVSPIECWFPPSQPNGCGPNSKYSECGTGCPTTCENPFEQICEASCHVGCFCDEGYVLRRDGSCVQFYECGLPPSQPNGCGPNSKYSECGTGCPTTCENPFEQTCEASCHVGCFCDEGYVLRRDGSCVQFYECGLPPSQPNGCGPNSKYSECGTGCPLTCENPFKQTCEASCHVGCFCDEGYVLRQDGSCVQLYECGLPPSPYSGLLETK